jgi:hypothetical protein
MTQKKPQQLNPNKMNALTKSLSVLAIGGIFAGTSFAGPNDAYAGPVAGRTPINPNYVTIALFRTGVTSAGAKVKAEKPLIPSANPKMPGVTQKVTRSK